jgi:hypothetical protein
MGAKELIIALMVGAIILVPGIYLVSDLSRVDTYNATLGDNATQALQTRTNLQNLNNKLNSTFATSINVRNNVNDTSTAQASFFNIQALNIAQDPYLALGLSTFNMLYSLPSLVLEAANIVLVILPFDLGYLVLGLAGIVGFILVAAAIEIMTGRSL